MAGKLIYSGKDDEKRLACERLNAYFKAVVEEPAAESARAEVLNRLLFGPLPGLDPDSRSLNAVEGE